jgi:hypothetical protein
LDFIQIFLFGVGICELCLLWEMLSDESVGILIGSSFVGTIGMSEVDIYLNTILGFELVLHHLVICELSSVVEGNTFDFVSWYMRHESRED